MPITLAALAAQTVVERLEVIVIDDGSKDDTSGVAAANGVKVVRHKMNCGAAAARNAGIAASSAPWVAFLDDDCEPEPRWAEKLLAASRHGAVGVGGAVTIGGRRSGYMRGYLERNNPYVPLEAELASSTALTYRCWRYVLRNVSRPSTRARPAYSLVGGNMAFERAALVAIGGFDERFTFGAEEVELCLRLIDRFGASALWFEPTAVVQHHSDALPRTLFGRYRSYGYGAGRLYRKRHDLPPTIFPLPLLVGVLLLAGLFDKRTLLAAALFPQAVFARGFVEALDRRSLSPLADCYVKMLHEASWNVGWVAGAWHYRHWTASGD